MKSWEDLRTDFRRVVGRQGVQATARAIPAARTTVYRLLKQDTQRPSRAVLANIERLVQEQNEKPRK